MTTKPERKSTVSLIWTATSVYCLVCVWHLRSYPTDTDTLDFVYTDRMGSIIETPATPPNTPRCDVVVEIDKKAYPTPDQMVKFQTKLNALINKNSKDAIIIRRKDASTCHAPRPHLKVNPPLKQPPPSTRFPPIGTHKTQ